MNGKFIEFHIESLWQKPFVCVLAALHNSFKLAFSNFLNAILVDFLFFSIHPRRQKNV